jgi:DNA-binding MarR family transcriptional regulator
MNKIKKIVPASKTIEPEITESAFNVLINETSIFFHRLKIVAEEVHHQGEMSGALRGLLRSLDKHGEQTVPQLARDRSVTRQHIQPLVNQLAEAGYIEFVENPAHKRSPFARLTRQGKKTVDAMNRREHKLVSKSGIGVSDQKMREAAETLRKVRAFFESDQWQQMLKTVK